MTKPRKIWTIDGLPEHHRAQAAAKMAQPETVKARASEDGKIAGKGRSAAVKTADSTGWIHPSKLQAHVTDDLRADAHSVIPEISIPLSQRPRDRIRLDGLIIEEMLDDPARPGRFIAYIGEAKGWTERTWLQKARRFTDTYRVPINVIKK
jgi:hypothetical protein